MKKGKIIEIVSKGQIKRLHIQNPVLFDAVAKTLGYSKAGKCMDICCTCVYDCKGCRVLDTCDNYTPKILN